MKTFKKTILFLFLTTLTFSCSSDDDNTDSGSQGEGIITALVNDETFESDSNTSSIVTSDGSLIIAAANSEGELIGITILNFEGEGTYPFDLNDDNMSFAAYRPSEDQEGAITSFVEGPQGSITITDYTENGNTISGNFNFAVQRVPTDGAIFEITNGNFSNFNIQRL